MAHSYTSNEILDKLKEPFHQDDLEWRVQQSGIKNNKPWAIVVPYVTSRAIQQRLDDVLGMDWKNEFKSTPVAGGTLCGLSIKVDGEWVTRWDGAENTKIEAVKGGLSDAEKRAAVQWGIGRYLYKLGAFFADCSTGKEYDNSQKFQEMKYNPNTRKKEPQGEPVFGSWREPELPSWATPKTYIKIKQIRELEKLVNDSGTELDSLLEYMNVSSLSRIKTDDYDSIIDTLLPRKERHRRAECESMLKLVTMMEESVNENMLNKLYIEITDKTEDHDLLVYVTESFEEKKHELLK